MGPGRCVALAAMMFVAALVPSGTEAKGYYNSAYGRTYYYGHTNYYFYYGGTRHYYGARTWGNCDGHCDQDIQVTKTDFTIRYERVCQATYDADALYDSNHIGYGVASTCASATTASACRAMVGCTYYSDNAVSALIHESPSLRSEWITKTDFPNALGGPTISFSVFIPDGMSSDAFRGTVTRCLEDACQPYATSAVGMSCRIAHSRYERQTDTAEAKCGTPLLAGFSSHEIQAQMQASNNVAMNDVDLSNPEQARATMRVTRLSTRVENGAALTLPSMLCMVLAAAASFMYR